MYMCRSLLASCNTGAFLFSLPTCHDEEQVTNLSNLTFVTYYNTL